MSKKIEKGMKMRGFRFAIDGWTESMAPCIGQVGIIREVQQRAVCVDFGVGKGRWWYPLSMVAEHLVGEEPVVERKPKVGDKVICITEDYMNQWGGVVRANDVIVEVALPTLFRNVAASDFHKYFMFAEPSAPSEHLVLDEGGEATMQAPEEWLKENAYPFAYNRGVWTNDILHNMKRYAEYTAEKHRLECERLREAMQATVTSLISIRDYVYSQGEKGLSLPDTHNVLQDMTNLIGQAGKIALNEK